MEKVKMFVKNHKKAVIVTGIIVVSFLVGYKRGYKVADRCYDKLITKVFLESIENVTHF